MRTRLSLLLVVVLSIAGLLPQQSAVAGVEGIAGSATGADARKARADAFVNRYQAGRVNPETLDRERRAIGATNISIPSPGPQQDGPSILSVPIDAFSMNGFAFHFEDPPADYIVMTWGFRSNYVNGSDPDDAAGMSLGYFDPNCYEFPQWSNVPSKGGGHPERMYIKVQNATGDGIVYGVDDVTSGFVLYPDSGEISAWIDWKNQSGCARNLVGVGYYEHNQDGGGTWTAEIGLPGMRLSYSGSGISALQKSTSLLDPNP